MKINFGGYLELKQILNSARCRLEGDIKARDVDEAHILIVQAIEDLKALVGEAPAQHCTDQDYCDEDRCGCVEISV